MKSIRTASLRWARDRYLNRLRLAFGMLSLALVAMAATRFLQSEFLSATAAQGGQDVLFLKH